MPDECERCVYRPCGKSEQDMKYCLIRFLIAESKQYRKERKFKNENRER